MSLQIQHKSKQIHNPQIVSKIGRLLVLFRSELGLRVGDVNVQSGGSFDDQLSFLGADTLGDLASVLPVAHHQAVELVNVVNEELFEAKVITAAVSRVLAGSITDGRVAGLTAESSTEGTIDTLGAPP